MRFAFYPQSLVPFHAYSLEERPLGGTETGVIRLAESLNRLGHAVGVFTSHRNPPESIPKYYPLEAIRGLQAVDVFISIREWIPLVYPLPAKRKFFWTGDAADQVHSFGLGDKRVANLVSGVLTVSDWHAENLSFASGFPREKCYTLRNGIHLPHFEGALKRPKKPWLVYASTPFRGLEHLIRLFPEIRREVPAAELFIASGFDVYRGKEEYNKEIQARYRPVFQALQNIPGVTVLGNVKQRELAELLLQSKVLAYPNTFQETSCIVAMEAQAAGCVPVTTHLGALPETIGKGGVVLPGMPGELAYDKAFIEASVKLLTDEKYYTSLSKAANARALAAYSWDSVAERFIRYLSQDEENK